jgi:hypothetical protein
MWEDHGLPASRMCFPARRLSRASRYSKRALTGIWVTCLHGGAGMLPCFPHQIVLQSLQANGVNAFTTHTTANQLNQRSNHTCTFCSFSTLIGDSDKPRMWQICHDSLTCHTRLSPPHLKDLRPRCAHYGCGRFKKVS